MSSHKKLPAWKQAQIEQKHAMRRLRYSRPLVWGKGITADLGIRRWKRANKGQPNYGQNIRKLKQERWQRIAPPGVKV